MNTKQTVEKFLAQKRLAVVGVSRTTSATRTARRAARRAPRSHRALGWRISKEGPGDPHQSPKTLRTLTAIDAPPRSVKCCV